MPLTKNAFLTQQLKEIKFEENRITFPSFSPPNSYIASIASSLIREKLIDSKTSFTFETVMSSDDKIRALERAQDVGFKNYLYYIATDDPDINIQRVQNRVRAGGHSVPEEKIRQRYYRSLNLLLDAIRFSDRAFIFDNSGNENIWLAEVTPTGNIDIKVDEVPDWFYNSIFLKI